MIKFISHASCAEGHSISNKGRTDIYCFFGCRTIHRKESSTKRSVDYNRSTVGKIKKKILNKQRSKVKEKKKHEKATQSPRAHDFFIYLKFISAVVSITGVFLSLTEKIEILSMKRH